MLTVLATTTFKDIFGDTPTKIFINATLPIVAAYFMYRWIAEPIYRSLRGMWNFWKMRDRPNAILEITPSEHIEKSPLATQQLFATLRQLISKDEVMPIEIDATRKYGTRYVIHTHPSDIAALQRQIASYIPEAQFRTLDAVPEEIPSDHTRVFEIKQAAHYANPLQAHEELDQSDPVTSMVGAMTKLKPSEKITMQLVLAPHHSYWTSKLYGKMIARDLPSSTVSYAISLQAAHYGYGSLLQCTACSRMI